MDQLHRMQAVRRKCLWPQLNLTFTCSRNTNPVYRTTYDFQQETIVRMRFQAIVHSLAVLLIVPSIFIINKMPNRARSKRVIILKNLMYWLIINGVAWVIKSATLLGGVWQPDPHGRFPVFNQTRIERKSVSSTGSLRPKSATRRGVDENQLIVSHNADGRDVRELETGFDRINELLSHGRYDNLEGVVQLQGNFRRNSTEASVRKQPIRRTTGESRAVESSVGEIARSSRCRRESEPSERHVTNVWMTALCWFHGLIMRLVS